MAIATLGAFVLAVWTKSGDYVEGIAVMLFYQIGELFQSYAVGKSRRNISALMDIRPGLRQHRKGRQARAGRPGRGRRRQHHRRAARRKGPAGRRRRRAAASSLNTSALTGESLPRDVGEGDEIISGCINMTGVLKIRTTKEFGESTVSKILDLVENASSRKSQLRGVHLPLCQDLHPRRVHRARWLLGVAVPPAAHWPSGMTRSGSTGSTAPLTFLVVSCPCALVISIPLSFFAGIGGASKEGVLIKGSNYLEALSTTKIVVFDKTGTLTQGVFEVTAVHHNELDDDKAAGIRRAGRVRLLSPHQQKPAEGLRQGH